MQVVARGHSLRDAQAKEAGFQQKLGSVSGAMKWIFFGRNENARKTDGFSSRFP
jgi:hypothetical protein